MTTVRLEYKPGIDIESSATASRGGWNASNNMRWRQGYPEKMRGWQKFCPQAVAGISRAMHFWYDLNVNPYLVLGTTAALQIMSGIAGSPLFNITPSGLTPGNPSSGSKPFSLRIWSLDNFGQVLLACPSGGALYSWTPPVMTALAAIVATAPPHSQGGFMTMPQRIMMMFGSSPDAGTLDPLLVRWCDQDDFTIWVPSVTNLAGSFRLSRGSRIVGGIQGTLGIFLFTDIDVWTVQFEGFPNAFGFFQTGSNCGLVSQKAVCNIGSVIYWMSPHGFFRMTGDGIEQIACSVWDAVFLDIDLDNADKIVVGSDYHFSEFWVFYPSKSGRTGEIDRFAKLNIAENLWDIGLAQMARTAWTDQNNPGGPLGIDLRGFVQHHDTGIDADGETLLASITSGFNDMQDGGAMVYVDRYLPDFTWDGDNPSINVTIFVRDYSQSKITQRGPFRVTPATEFVKIDARGREWQEQIEVTASDTWYRRGVPRLVISPDGSL